MKHIYLDYAAATPVDERVLAAMKPYFSDRFYNPSAPYRAAKEVASALDEARAIVARWLGVKSHEVIFTAGGTEANNLAISGVMRRFPNSNVVVSALEHESVIVPSEQFEHHLAPVGMDGITDLKALEDLINDKTVLISIMYANNEIGTVQPLKKIAQLIDKIRQKRTSEARSLNSEILPLYFHSDASQAGNYLDLHVHRLGVDLFTINGGKIYGPKQSGALFVRNGIKLTPLILGGGQERGLRSGTENVAGAIGLAHALSTAQTMRLAETERMSSLSELFFRLIRDLLPSAQVNGSRKHRLPNNVHLTIPGQLNERLLIELEAHGIVAAAGSACSASDDLPSHVLVAIGLDDAAAQASVRFSLGRSTTDAQIRQTVVILKDLTKN